MHHSCGVYASTRDIYIDMVTVDNIETKPQYRDDARHYPRYADLLLVRSAVWA